VAEQLAASQEELCSMKFGTNFVSQIEGRTWIYSAENFNQDGQRLT
jgi:hypothetical protein